MTEHILVVEDDEAISAMICDSLETHHYECSVAVDISQAEAALDELTPSMILLDWMLPGISGLEFARRIRRTDENRFLPIIMITARATEEDKLMAFKAGIDDFVVKPFSVKELLARIQAVIRRSQQLKQQGAVEIGGLKLDIEGHRVSVDGNPIHLGPTEFRLLQFFVDHKERVLSRAQLLDQVWGSDVYVEERTVDVHVRRLRVALKATSIEESIQTVHGMGYRFSL